MELTQKNFGKLINGLNHRMTELESHTNIIKNDLCAIKTDMKWMKKLGYYMAGIITAIFIALLNTTFNVI